MEFNMEVLEGLFRAILIVVIPVLSKFVIDFVREKIDELMIKNEYKEYEFYFKRLNQIIEAVVVSLNQTVVEYLKTNAEFTKEAQKEVFNTAKSEILNIIDDEMKDVLKNIYVDIDSLITHLIESKVNEIKNQRGV